MNMYWNQR